MTTQPPPKPNASTPIVEEPCDPSRGQCTACGRVALFESATCGCSCHRTHLVLVPDGNAGGVRYVDIETLAFAERVARLRNLAEDATLTDEKRAWFVKMGGSAEWHVEQVTKLLHRELPPDRVLALLDAVDQLRAALVDAVDLLDITDKYWRSHAAHADYTERHERLCALLWSTPPDSVLQPFRDALARDKETP